MADRLAGMIGGDSMGSHEMLSDREAPWVQVGARWAVIPERLFIDSSWGRQVDSNRARQLTVGLKFSF